MKKFTTLLTTLAGTLLITSPARAGSTGTQENVPDQEQVQALAAELFKALSAPRTEKADSAVLGIVESKFKVIKRYLDGMMEIGCLVKVLNPDDMPLEVCIDFLDVDGFAMDQFCRSTAHTPSKFTRRGDTTVFRCARILEDAKSCASTEASVREIKALKEK